MDKKKLKINDLRLRVPGIKAQEGYSFGDSVVRQVALGLHQGRPRLQLGALDLKVKVPRGIPSHRIVSIVAEAIIKGLR